jgi:CRISPR-associated protein Csb3
VTGVVLAGADPQELLSHLLLYGVGAICEEAGLDRLRLTWTAGMRPRPAVSGAGLDADVLARIVHEHAVRHAEENSWLRAELPGGGALLSPRIGRIPDPAAWHVVQTGRHAVLDQLLTAGAALDLRLLAALGEPAYWRVRRNESQQDEAASALEMQPRNAGSEFVGTRLRPLAAAVAARGEPAVGAGLLGELVRDEVGNQRGDSRTATGLRGPGPTDNAVAWCALWGISQVPLALRVTSPARTAAYLEDGGRAFVVPVWRAPWHPARLRTVLASQALPAAARELADAADTGTAQEVPWLVARGVRAVVRFAVERYGSANAPERRAGRGQILRLPAE